jgi:hypothetical protein
MGLGTLRRWRRELGRPSPARRPADGAVGASRPITGEEPGSGWRAGRESSGRQAPHVARRYAECPPDGGGAMPGAAELDRRLGETRARGHSGRTRLGGGCPSHGPEYGLAGAVRWQPQAECCRCQRRGPTPSGRARTWLNDAGGHVRRASTCPARSSLRPISRLPSGERGGPAAPKSKLGTGLLFHLVPAERQRPSPR